MHFSIRRIIEGINLRLGNGRSRESNVRACAERDDRVGVGRCG